MTSTRIFIPALCTLILAGCQVDGPGFSPTARNAGFKDNYTVARNALEKGRFAKAERSYQNLLSNAGPLEPRIRLEYAHTLLRSGKFAEAAGEAQRAVAVLDGMGKAAALAVQATAEQELVRAAILEGTVEPGNAEARLLAARSSFDQVLESHPELDPIGALAERRRLIDAEISALK